MDSGDTALGFLLLLSIAVFMGLHAGVALLPLLRRAAVRDTLPRWGGSASAVHHLRTRRQAYEELISLLLLMSSAAISASALALVIRVFSLHWTALAGVLAGLWLLLLLLVPLVKYMVERLPVAQMLILWVVGQALLWPLLPIRRFFRSGLRFAGADQETDQGGGNGHENGNAVRDVHEEIAEEQLAHHEQEMIHAILHLDETLVREIMVPRVDVVTVEADTSVERAATRMLDSGHSRLPVYQDVPDNIIGMLYSRDLLAAALAGVREQQLRDLMRPAFFVPESKRVDEMLTEFQARRIHMAIVVDEYGSTTGIVTVEDLIEEIVGEIEDEFDKGQPDIQWLADGAALVEAKMPVDDFSETFGVAVEADGFDTVGGLLFTRLGKVPAVGDLVVESGLELRVMTTIGRRIKRVKVAPAPEGTTVPESN